MPRVNKIWLLSRDEFISLINENNSIVDILKKIGISHTSSGNFATFKKRVILEGIDLSNLTERSKEQNKKQVSELSISKKRSDEEVFAENSTYPRHLLKARLIKEGVLKEICAECGISNEWNGKPLNLQLDHINGVNNDNRLENLRLLCPNCHSQTETFCSKNIGQ